MYGNDIYPLIDRFARGLIRRKARQLVGRAGFTEVDRKDLQQELVLRLLQRLPAFDPDRAHRNAFAVMVIERAVANILRDRHAEKRDERRTTSLQVPIETGGEGPIDLAGTVSRRDSGARRRVYPRSDEERAQLASDVADVLADLPVGLRSLAERLKRQSLSEIACEIGIPRTTLYEAVRRIRQRFERAGLRDYLARSSSPRTSAG